MNKKLQELTRKKKELDKLTPLPKDIVKKLDEWFNIELTYNSNAIEGNSLSRIETAKLIKHLKKLEKLKKS